MPGSDNIRKKIRDTAKILISGNTAAGANVFTSRVDTLYRVETPAIVIYTGQDVPVISESHPTNFERRLQLFANILVQAKTPELIPEDLVDQIAGEIEDLLLPNYRFQDPPPKALQGVPWVDAVDPGPEIIDNIRLGPFDSAKEMEGLQDIMGGVAEYEVIYTYAREQGSIDDFLTGDSTYNLENSQEPDDRARDEFPIPT